MHQFFAYILAKGTGMVMSSFDVMQDTYVYQVAANRLYPVVSPIADPALDKLTHSPVYTAVKDHLTPPVGDGSIPPPATPALCAQC